MSLLKRNESEGINLFLDDVRNPPVGWVVCRTVELAKRMLERGGVARVSLDHDMDFCVRCHGDVDANGVRACGTLDAGTVQIIAGERVPVLTSAGGQPAILAPCSCDPKPENGLQLLEWLIANRRHWPTLGEVYIHSANRERAAEMRRMLEAAKGVNEPPAPVPVHYSALAQQPDVQVLCSGAWGIPAWVGQKKLGHLPREVYELDISRAPRVAYTFERSIVTCPDCLAKMKADAPERAG